MSTDAKPCPFCAGTEIVVDALFLTGKQVATVNDLYARHFGDGA